MNFNSLPAPVLAKLLAFEATAEDLAQRIAKNEDGIALARRRLTGALRDAEHDDLLATLRDLTTDQPDLRRKLHAAQAALAACKLWLDQLPEGTTLEPVDVKPNSQGAENVLAQIAATATELANLRAVPVPSADIEQRIRAYGT